MHPLVTDLQSLSDEEIVQKLNALMQRIRSPLMRRDPNMYAQLIMVLEDYQAENQRRIIANSKKFKAENKDLDSKIDIQ